MKFGDIIYKQRKELGLTMYELASKIYKKNCDTVKDCYINEIEKNRKIPMNNLIYQFADVLKINAEYLFYLADRFPPNECEKLNEFDFLVAMQSFRKIAEK